MKLSILLELVSERALEQWRTPRTKRGKPQKGKLGDDEDKVWPFFDSPYLC